MSDDHGRLNRRHPLHLPARELCGRPVIVFLTLCTAKRKPILATPRGASTILNAWRVADGWQVGRYVIMPDHVHLFCAPVRHEVSLEMWIRYWKSLVARTWPARDNPPIWQRHFWDTQLRQGESYRAKWDYVQANPVRRGLVRSADAWPFAGELNVLDWD